MGKIAEQKIYFSTTDTVNAWMGNNGFYEVIWQLDIWKWRIVIWKLPKFIDIKK